MKTYQSLKLQSLVIALVFVIISLIGISLFPGLYVLPVTAALALVGLSWRLYRALHRQIREQQFTEFRQLEALTGLYATLDIQHPLPRTRHTAASPDFLHLLSNEIFRLRPRTIVEVGSGTSTLVAAYCLKKIGSGKILSLDHLQKYADITCDTIRSHGLEDFADVVHAPLKQYDFGDLSQQWYDDASLQEVNSIDLLIVDGPPMNVAARARYPAIPVLQNKLSDYVVVLLDDGAREAETETVDLWKQKFGLECSLEPLEKGAFRGTFRQPIAGR